MIIYNFNWEHRSISTYTKTPRVQRLFCIHINGCRCFPNLVIPDLNRNRKTKLDWPIVIHVHRSVRPLPTVNGCISISRVFPNNTWMALETLHRFPASPDLLPQYMRHRRSGSVTRGPPSKPCPSPDLLLLIFYLFLHCLVIWNFIFYLPNFCLYWV